MTSLADYIQRVCSRYPGNFFSLDPFPKANLQAPILLKGQINRVLVYKGCFSPPHVGHLALLKHTFEHGGRDLNMIAAIVSPGEGCGHPATAKCSGKVMSFTMKERVALWKNDERLPEWAWVYENPVSELRKLMYCLVETAEKDGYQLEFVALFRPDRSGWLYQPFRRLMAEVTLVDSDGDKKYVMFQGCNVTLICDAARKAVEFDTGRLKRFKGCEPWRRLRPDTEVSIREEKVKAENMMAMLKEKDPHEYQRLVEEAGSEAAAIGEMVKRFVTEATKDSQHIIVCHAKEDESILRRFVRLDRSAPGYQETVVSGTILRNVIETEAETVKAKLEAMALSPGLLGQMMELEIGTGAGGKNDGGRVVDLKACAAVKEEVSEKTE